MASVDPACPSDPATIDVTAADLHDQLATLCKRVLGEVGGDAAWSAVDLSEIKVCQISGGITNMLYRVGPKEGSPSSGAAPRVLARVFGKAGDVVCDRQKENATFAELSKAGFGPKLHGLFGNGRLEGWLEGRRPLEALEMLQTEPVDFPKLIARRLADMHERCGAEAGSEVWSQLREWVALAKEVAFPDDPAKAEKLRKLNPFPRFEVELDALEDLLPSPKNGQGAGLLEKFSGAARKARELLYERRFCHLDLLSGNIMYSEADGDLRFIDFEYAADCYVGLDVANHFNAVPESCLVLNDTFDVDQYFPGRDLQSRWIRAYFEARGVQVDDELLEELLKAVLEFSLLAELRWVIWSVVQAGSSPVDFDYLEYGIMRFEQGFMKYKAWRDAGRRP